MDKQHQMDGETIAATFAFSMVQGDVDGIQQILNRALSHDGFEVAQNPDSYKLRNAIKRGQIAEITDAIRFNLVHCLAKFLQRKYPVDCQDKPELIETVNILKELIDGMMEDWMRKALVLKSTSGKSTPRNGV